ncbi:MAG TPA: CDP-alcohol phosphatidyltransferase family protein [Nitrospinae bacterium]|nr:CDP-alcohol phosphatidyltransferase family protein [Nitrospinota bacterium]
MTENHKQPDSGTPDNNSSGVLFLKNPGETENSIEWYSSKIAGVPFILRNLLTLQRAGIKTLAVFIEDSHGDIEKSFEKLLKDSRLPKDILWIKNIPQLKEWMQNNPTYIFNGSALHNRKELHSLVHSHSKNEGASAFPIDPEKLDELLIDNPTAIQSQQAGFPLYVPGAKEEKIQKPEDFKRLHEAQVSGSGLSHDSPITRILSRPASRLLTRMFLNTPISPNQITLISFFLGLVSAFLFLQGSYETSIIAAMLLVLSTWVDGADGEIARLKFMETDIGKKLDIYCDNIIHFLVFTAIGCGVYFKTGESIFLYLGGLAGLGGLTAFFLLSPILLEKRSPNNQLFHIIEPELAEKFANRDFIHFLLLVSVIDQMGIFIAVAAVGANLFAGYLVYSRLLKLRTG